MNAITSATNKPQLKPQVDPPPVPISIEDLGIPQVVLENLLLKHLSHESKVDTINLSLLMGLSSQLVQELLSVLRNRSLIEVFQPNSDSYNGGKDRFTASRILYGLSGQGIQEAELAFLKDAYIGPAPVSLNDYNFIVSQQDIRNNNISYNNVVHALRGVYGAEYMVPILGPALNSGRALLLYGNSGTGKSYVAAQLLNAFDTSVYIPYSVYASGSVIKVYSELHHTQLDNNSSVQTVNFSDQYDRRWALCERPNIQVGGELTMDMLEINHSESNRVWMAPLQMLANNGLLIIDDLGRQTIPVDTLLNRWIVPMEYSVDYLVLPNGQQFSVPFVLTLAFSTNLSPLEISDPAFLRRLGYKIEFTALTESTYLELFTDLVEAKEFAINSLTIEHLLLLHRQFKVPFFPCIPKDIIGISQDIIKFEGRDPEVTANVLEASWRLYFTSDGLEGI
ncbi:AAA family ATPase [Vibrio sp. 10N.222.51.C12]|uniref:AAA family ATPase n=1 Tax=unclassified Vibrio TaxID=2614977 RepID=UPI000C8577B4|nr:AAA family ATPase [Vibrio sp. 10N.286.48.B7]PMH83266.1 AAA family ATPase [Vibrio sp. 10N.286.48.B7]